jgi:WhiB family redox-sensing transcriptional regulator
VTKPKPFRSEFTHRVTWVVSINPRDTDWMLQGACTREDPETFYPHRKAGAAHNNDLSPAEDVAVAICRQCPQVNRCAEYALTTREPYGVWGAMTEAQREAIYRRARRQAEQQAAS